jgi:hypothetical protein
VNEGEPAPVKTHLELVRRALRKGERKRSGRRLRKIHSAKAEGLLTMRRTGIGPALAGSVVLTTVTDVIGFFASLGLATRLLQNERESP